ncbi:transcriptional regulator swi6, partial [Rhizoclosmatium hyalinum]
MTAKDAEVTIKTSTYSNTPVIELIYKGMSVLRRSGYLAINGTQILTIGGVTERAKRARILDVKCIGEGWPVEKVQGGAGKFQGT